MEARLELEQSYISNWKEGRRMRKRQRHMKTLLEYFKKDPVWDYQMKVRIALEIGMTFNQVSKWNWD